jgi:hypothetical protein
VGKNHLTGKLLKAGGIDALWRRDARTEDRGGERGGPVGENAMWAGPESGAQRSVKRIQLKISNNFK